MNQATKEKRGHPRVSAVRNALTNSGGFVYCAIVSFCLAPVVVRELGDSRYGLWVLLSSVVGYMSLMDLGIRGAVMRYVANLHATARHEEAGRIASAGLFMFGVLAVVAVFIAITVALVLDRLFTVPDSMLRLAQLVLIIGGVNVGVSMVNGVFGGIIGAMERFDLISLVDASIETMRACLILLALSYDYGLVAFAGIQLAMSIARCTVSILISRRLYPQLRLRSGSWQRSHVRQLVSFSYYSMLLQVSTLLVLETDSVIIAAFLPIEMIAYFAIAASLVFYARSLIYGATYWITPRVSALQATEDQRSGGRLALISGRWVTLLLHGITLTLLFRGETFIRLWMGPTYGELGGPVLLILCLALLFEGGRVVIRATMQGLNQHKALVPVFLIEATCTLALCLILIQIWGIVGVALGTALPRMIASAIEIPRVFCRNQNISLWDGMRELWIRPGLAMIPFAVATFLVEYFTHVENLGVFFGTVLLVLPLGAIGGWRVGLHQSERDLLVRSAVSQIRERKLSLMKVESDTA